MITEQIAGRLRIFTSKARTAPQEIVEPAPQKQMVITPAGIVNGEDTKLKELVYESLDPNQLAAGELTLLPDQDERNIFVCDTNEKGNSKYWLDPQKWGPALSEFADFMSVAGVHDVMLQIVNHVPAETTRDNEWITLRPVLMSGTRKVRETTFMFGLTQQGRVSFGKTEIGYHDLGYLNPSRVRQEEMAALKRELFRYAS